MQGLGFGACSSSPSTTGPTTAPDAGTPVEAGPDATGPVTVTPATANVLTCDALQFKETGGAGNGSWSVAPASGAGTVDMTGKLLGADESTGEPCGERHVRRRHAVGVRQDASGDCVRGHAVRACRRHQREPWKRAVRSPIHRERLSSLRRSARARLPDRGRVRELRQRQDVRGANLLSHGRSRVRATVAVDVGNSASRLSRLPSRPRRLDEQHRRHRAPRREHGRRQDVPDRICHRRQPQRHREHDLLRRHLAVGGPRPRARRRLRGRWERARPRGCVGIEQKMAEGSGPSVSRGRARKCPMDGSTYYAPSDTNGGSAQTTFPIAAANGDGYSPRAGTNGKGSVCMVFQYNGGNSPSPTEVQCSQDNGGTWTAPVMITAPTADTKIHPTIAVSPAGKVVPWRGSDTVATAIQSFIAISTDGGKTFGAPIQYPALPVANFNVADPVVAWESDEILWISETANVGNAYTIFVDKTCDDGKTWSGAVDVEVLQGTSLLKTTAEHGGRRLQHRSRRRTLLYDFAERALTAQLHRARRRTRGILGIGSPGRPIRRRSRNRAWASAGARRVRPIQRRARRKAQRRRASAAQARCWSDDGGPILECPGCPAHGAIRVVEQRPPRGGRAGHP